MSQAQLSSWPPALPPRFGLLICLISVLAAAIAWQLFTHPVFYTARADAVPLHTRAPINAASVDVLELLPHVGPALAARIVAARHACGPFHSKADLEQVKGIGPTRAQDITPDVRFAPPDH